MTTEKKDMENKNYPLAQGNIGNCYLISFLRGMLRFQKEKYHDLLICSYYDIGYFEVALFKFTGLDINKKTGVKVKVFVDDNILYNTSYNAHHFSHLINKDSSLISKYLLIEKAFAKLYGCYYNIYGRNMLPDYAIFSLTGIDPDLVHVYEYINYNKHQDLYNLIKDEINKKNVMICNSAGYAEKEKCSRNGIEYNHAYTIIGIEQEEHIFIINLENPYGLNPIFNKDKFQLRLKENNSAYRPEVNERIENQIKNYNEINHSEGLLKIDIENFTKCFVKIYICKFPPKKK